jgi:transposase
MAESGSRRPRRSRRSSPPVLERINPNAAGIDCGATTHVVAVPPDRDAQPVESFRTFTTDLQRLADWLVTCRVTSVALESTGVFWIPVYEILEARGLAVHLVNARHVRNLPGRKSDVSDAEWLRDLHSFGLLRASFRPTAAIVTLRTYMRHRHTLVELAAMHVQRMQKALVQMNLQLPFVISDITGQTGLRIMRAIVAGEHDPAQLATFRDRRCRATPAEITAALTGHYRPELLFALQQNLELYDACERQIEACDRAIEAHVRQLTTRITSPGPLPAPRAARQRIEPAFDVRSVLHHLTGGVDLTQIDGIGAYTALKVVAEIGTDMRRWPSAQHFTSWLTLAPKNKVSGGRLLSSQTQPSANRAAMAFRLAAASLGRTQTALGAFYRRIAARIGKPQAVTATARKLAVLVYHVLKGDFVYRDPGADAYDAQQRARQLRQLRQRATRLGFALVSHQTGEVLGG